MTTLIADPLVTALDIRDNGEPLVALAGYGIACAQPLDAVERGGWARRGVAARLATADEALPPGVRLFVVEAFRSPQSQLAIHATYSAQLRRARPAATADEIAELASRYVAPLEVAPHVAGAAVDVTLIDDAGRELPMGTAVDATPEESDGACTFDAPAIGAEARANRMILAAALGGAGLVNYPTEWWHWSFGDRYWAYVTGIDHAVYGPVSR